MSKKVFSKIFVLLLVVGLLFAVAPTKQAQAQTPTTLNVADWSETASVGLTGRPSVLIDGTTYHMWHGDGTVLYHSTSATADFEIPTTATATFVAGTPVIAELASVTVIKETDGFKMIAYGIDEQHFALYTSSDGTFWTHAGVVFDATGMNDMSKIDAPFVFNDGTEYKLYFQKKNAAGDKYEIYLVTSESIGGTYTNPTLVLSPSANIADWDGKFVMHPTVVKDGGTYYMWYSAHNSVDPQRIGLATSLDGINWTKSPANPVIGSVGEPSVIKVGDTWHMYYLGTGSAVQYISATGPLISAPTLSIVPVGGETQCGPTTNTVVDITINDLDPLTPLQSYTVTMGFDSTEVSIAEADIVNGGLLPDGGTFMITPDTGKIEVVYTVLGETSGSGTGSLLRITLTHVGDPDSITLTLDQETSRLSGPDGYFLPIGSVSGTTITRQDVVVQNTTTGVGYCDLATATNALATGNTLELLTDITVTGNAWISKASTFDTKGFDITRTNATAANQAVFIVQSANVNIIGSGTLTSTNSTDPLVQGTTGSAIYVQSNGTLTLDGPTLSGGDSSVWLYSGLTSSANFTMNSGTLTNGLSITGKLHTTTINGGLITISDGPFSPIASNATAGGTLTINGGVIDGNGLLAIYHPQPGILNINGGTITGAAGIEMRAGTLTIADDPALVGTPTIIGTAGDAIFMNGNVTDYTGLLSATISGGEFNSTGGYALRETAPATTRTSNIAVSGGKFTGSLGAVFFTTVDPLILKLTGGAYNTDPAVYVFVPYHTSEDADEYFRIYSLLPVITSDDIQGYYLVDEEREFHVSMTNPIGAAAYEAVMFKVTITGATKTDITSAQFYETGWPLPADWYDLPLQEVNNGAGGTDLVGWYGGIFYGGFGLPADDVTHTEKLRVNFAVPGDYPITLELYTVTGNDLGEPYDYSTEAGQLITTESFVMNAYTRPVVTSDLDLLGPVPTNTATSVTFNISNPDKLTGTFDLLLDLPVNTIVEYNGQTYTCGISGCLIPVDMDSASEELVMTMTFPYPFSGPVYGALLDPAYTPDRELALFTSESNLIVVDANGIHAVTGNILMQGRYGAGGVKVLLSSPVFHPHVYDASSANGGDYDLGLVVGTELTFTTDQPRYLNVTADLNKTFTLSKAETLNALVLRGGNAQESGNENVIDTRDLGLVGSAYGGTTTSETPGDVNFDLIVDIRDLSLVGGNWGLTSYQAYSGWEPLGE